VQREASDYDSQNSDKDEVVFVKNFAQHTNWVNDICVVGKQQNTCKTFTKANS
jgi:hypothetical protein